MQPDSELDSLNKESATPGRVVRVKLVVALLVGVVPMFGVAIWLVGFDLVPLGFSLFGYLLGATLTLWLFLKGYPHQLLGTANRITLLRLALIAALLAAFLETAPTLEFILVATIALLLDRLDGWFARRENLASQFGARFDIEVDSAFALILALTSWASGATGPLILLLAVPRYLFVGFAQVLPWLKKPTPSRLSGKLIGLFQTAALIVLNIPGLESWLVLAISLAVAVALLWSFGRDIVYLYKFR